MKSRKIFLAAGVIAVSLITGGCNSNQAAGGPFAPKENVSWVVTSKPGGGSDIYTRMISDIMVSEKMLDQTVLVTNKTDGGGEIGRNEVANTKGKKSDYTLLTFNSGDLMPMVQNTANRSKNFRILAIMAVDKQLIFKGEKTRYQDFSQAIEAAKNGTKVVIGGSKGDDIATYEAMLTEIGLTQDQMSYITYDSTGDAITAILGGHIEFVISKPAAASEYVEAGALIPVLALAEERYSGNLADAPTLSEIGDYKNVEIPVWRGVAAPAAMSDAAAAYWSDLLGKVAQTDKWKTEYLEKNKLIADYKDMEAAAEYVTRYEEDFMAANGIK
ncbi:Bug family tripartite tricarboxylate transporter substrate binding protein [Lacrimispora sp.]|uniref:Bug family tripartite tricarboxylate transporter substrate binding protein n=1 Tax=Lacrimispora sp. TaxID=2719234 RepID=UPI0028ABD969|nr:tripartite tricarboxylate transporter substrate-binding protein [Lacrimispora sp.]